MADTGTMELRGNNARIGRVETLKRFVRFGFVGASGMVVDMGVLFLLADSRTLGWGLSLSKTLAAEVAIINNFIWNDLWTFRDLVVPADGRDIPLRCQSVGRDGAPRRPRPAGLGERGGTAVQALAGTQSNLHEPPVEKAPAEHTPHGVPLLGGSQTPPSEACLEKLPVWKDPWRARAGRFSKFNLICLAGIGFNVLLLNAQVRMLHFNVYVANFIAIFVVSLWNFWMNLKFGWGKAA